MIATKLSQLLAACILVTLLNISTPAQAMSLESHGHVLARHAHINEVSVRRKRATGRKCKNRPPAFSSKAQAVASKTVAKTAKPTKAPVKNIAPPSNGPGRYTGGKMCLAWPNGEDPSLAKFKTDKVGPIYTWSPYIPSKAKQLGFKPVPMLWGWKQVGEFNRLVVKGYADTILGPNEPNLGDQSNMSPGDAANLWKQHIEPKRALGYRTISPATTSAPSGKQWLKDMLSACNGGCTFDAIALHWYGTSADEFIKYVQDHRNTFNKPIWVTEFACHNFSGGAQCDKGQVFNFVSKVTAFMDGADYVETYCPFGVMHNMVGVNPLNQLMKPNGDPTDLAWSFLT